ncbi:hypothetical protein BN8_04333 [Fibrisoma limi BUZ 3]|uniref:Lipoprotein n=1 Tax=Fibrisoma limi BUZ 3 TaxID=1185876 RepID=I2GMH0_9BACT|nr:hypothetical protein [Fibrisoma limi]CCH55098.1 hypothetical protein BN8_04333 [Fibrisoma limi BUZ 3]
MKFLFAILLLCVGIFSCNSTEKRDPLLEEAALYHNEATEIQAIIEPKIDQIDSLKTILVKSPKQDATATVATLDSLKTAFEEWEENLVEVPGMPHNHNHNGPAHHHHNDATLKDLPADQMRDLQRETLSSIKQIQQRLDAVMAQVTQ